ncbi:family 43 glycosylhydrolase [Pedococcus sp. 5OH_020]|uniref:family 43 glycosylhydrolase n=1 Tax=Pedococcus sp. 5OH_020 TaxID=2989814 RepID=UPI0022EA049B|nr:family 43 glycosylhydrolase [Pedococcus sp. 5OH_020]
MRSRRIAPALAAAGLAAAIIMPATLSVAPSASAATGTTINSSYIADPGFTRVDGSTWLVAGTGGSRNGASDGILPIFRRSTPTGTFAKTGNIYSTKPAGYAGFWAPHIVKRGSYYFAFFAASKNGAKHCVYWASSRSYWYGYSAPHQLACGAAAGWEAIDSSVYVTSAGNSYLVWRRGNIRAFPIGDYDINARMLTFSGSAVGFTSGSQVDNLLHRVNDKVYEAPSLLRHGGRVWLFVSRDRFDTNAYHTDVYVADSIHGTFRWVKTLMKEGQGYGHGPGGAEVTTDATGGTWIAWHVWDRDKPTPSSPGARITKTAQLRWVNGLPAV